MKKDLLIVGILSFIVLSSFVFLIFYLSFGGITGNVVKEDGNVLLYENKVYQDNETLENVEDSLKILVEKEIIEKGFVGKVIDGDTVVVNGESVRLLGIDTDERGYDCYKDAKVRMEELVLNKNVLLEKDGENKGIYDRYLRYLFVDEINVNLKMVEEGLAVSRFSSLNKKYKEEILDAEKNARELKKGCKWKDYEGDSESRSEEDYCEFGSGCNDVFDETVEEVELEEGIIGACDAKNHIGFDGVVEGNVVAVFKSETNTVFLNFEKDYPNQCFTGVIFSSDVAKFNYKSYEGLRVRLKGEIQEYEGRAEIILFDNEQVEVMR